MKNERVTPKGYKLIRRNKALNIEIYGKDLCAIGYHGRKKKANFHFRFQSKDRMKQYLDEWIDGRKRAAEQVKQRKLDAKKANEFQVGDILYNSWGWEQTNIDFYQVVKRTDASIWIRPIAYKLSSHGAGYMSGNKVALKDQFTSEEITRKAVRFGNGCNFDYGWGRKWDGRPVSCSWYA